MRSWFRILSSMQHLRPRHAGRRLRSNILPPYPAQTRWAALCGVDLTTIPGIQVLTAHTIWAELGSDLSAFPSGKHFRS